MAVDLLTREEDLQALVPEWRRLAVAQANAFVTPDWYLAYLAAYPGEADPWVLATRGDDGSLQGLWPLTRSRGRRPALKFAGSSLGDEFEPVVAQGGDATRIASELAARLAGERGWRSLMIENAPADAPWLAAVPGSGLALTLIPHRAEVLPMITIDGRSYDEYLAARSRNFRSQMGRKRRSLEKEGELLFRRSDAESLDRDLETFFGLHEARWSPRGGSQALTDRSRDFHRRFARAALEQGWLRLWLMELDSKPISAWYGWSLGGRYAYYLAGFDPDWSRFSVGQLLLAHTIADACAEGVAEYDLLLGGESYKGRFAEGERHVETALVSRRFSRERATATAERLTRGAVDRLPESARDSVKGALGGAARRSPSHVER